MSKRRGRPIDPTSERAREPWEAHGLSRASWYWKKRYGDLPISVFKMQWSGELRNELRKLVRKHSHYDLWVTTEGWSSSSITRAQIVWLIKKMGLTRKANRIAARFAPTLKPFVEFADEGVAQPPYQPLVDLRDASPLYGACNEQEKARFDTAAMQVLAKVVFAAQ
jgi:hypothetical protein